MLVYMNYASGAFDQFIACRNSSTIGIISFRRFSNERKNKSRLLSHEVGACVCDRECKGGGCMDCEQVDTGGNTGTVLRVGIWEAS